LTNAFSQVDLADSGRLYDLATTSERKETLTRIGGLEPDKVYRPIGLSGISEENLKIPPEITTEGIRSVAYPN
jgi:hypothetical protein